MSERAIAHFQEQNCRNDVSYKEMCYNDSAILALRKQVPKLVEHKRTYWYYAHYCPSCSACLSKEGLKYCNDCGQALDWSNYESGLKYLRRAK